MHYRLGYYDLSGWRNVSLSSLVKTGGYCKHSKIIIFLTLSAIVFENDSLCKGSLF